MTVVIVVFLEGLRGCVMSMYMQEMFPNSWIQSLASHLEIS